MAQPIVKTVEGKLQGCVRKNFDGREFYSFLGVPYAKPPIANLRFKAPEPLEPWNGVKDATKEGSRIYQRDLITTKSLAVSGSEDGLHLNVFTKKPIPQGSKLKPVMVWIHGGGFVEGFNNTNIYGPEYLMMEDIVLVTFNYRLGFLGFLEMEDPSLEIFGNAALKDQLEALKWVQRNIRNFGGDPDNVTIFGESAGGKSVWCLLYCPRARGLFHRAILQSGCYTKNIFKTIPYTKGFIEFIRKKTDGKQKVLEYLRSLSVEKLFEFQEDYLRSLPMGLIGSLIPIAEKPNSTAIITSEYLDKGEMLNVPILIGTCSDESQFMYLMSDEKNIRLTNQLNIEKILTQTLKTEKGSVIYETYLKKCQNFYGETELDNVKMSADWIEMRDFDNGMELVENSKKPVFFYKFSLDSKLNVIKERYNLKFPGATHFDDVGYLFKTELPLEKGSPEEVYMRRVVKLWTNFAKYGNPTPDGNDLGITWKPYNKNTKEFLNIDKELVPSIYQDNEGQKIWREIKNLSLTVKVSKCFF